MSLSLLPSSSYSFVLPLIHSFTHEFFRVPLKGLPDAIPSARHRSGGKSNNRWVGLWRAKAKEQCEPRGRLQTDVRDQEGESGTSTLWTEAWRMSIGTGEERGVEGGQQLTQWNPGCQSPQQENMILPSHCFYFDLEIWRDKVIMEKDVKWRPFMFSLPCLKTNLIFL